MGTLNEKKNAIPIYADIYHINKFCIGFRTFNNQKIFHLSSYYKCAEQDRVESLNFLSPSYTEQVPICGRGVDLTWKSSPWAK